MHPKERLLGMAKLLRKQGKPIPLDMLVEAEQLGLVLTEFDQPKQTTANMEGDTLHDATEETDLYH